MPGARSAGMGYTGIALTSPQYINPTAPATWSRIIRTRVDASLLYEGISASDGRISRYLAETNFAGALLAIPISPLDGVVLVGGFTPYSNVDFNLATSGSYQSGSDQINYSLKHIGSGGLGQAQVGLSWAPGDPLSLGASLRYVFGTVDKTMQMPATPATYAVGLTSETNNIKGVLANVGAIYSGFGGVLRPLSLGVAVTAPSVFSSTSQKSFVFTRSGESSSDYDTLEQVSGDIKIPIALGFGLAWTVGERVVLAADYRAQAWGSSEFYGETPLGIRNSQMAGIGFEMGPSRDPSSSFIDHIAYRFGFVFNATYYQVQGIPINEWAGTAGLSIPVSGDTRLNLSAEYGARGKRSSPLVREMIFRLTASLTLGEMWFVRPDEE